MRRQVIGMALVAGLCTAGPAQATVVDFTSAVWSGSSSQDFGSVRVHISAVGGPLSVTSFDGNAGSPPCTPPNLACQTDGIGIGMTDDEVTFGGGEVLTVLFTDLFDNPTTVNLLGIQFFDLFLVHPADPSPETAQWTYNMGALGGGSLTGIAVGPGTGWHSTALAVSGVHSIEFFATSPLSSANTDFALAALEFEPIPEPATLALLGCGLLGLALRRSRRRPN